MPADDDSSGFTTANLPYGVATSRRWAGYRVVSRVGESVVELAALAEAGAVPVQPWWTQPSLNDFMAAGPDVWRRVREGLAAAAHDIGSSDPTTRDRVKTAFHPLDDVTLLRPVEVADYVDFYASEQHATNLGRILRPGQEPLPPSWRHLPIGYHGRSGTVVVSGTPVRRPRGQRLTGDEVTVGPTERLDVEVEVGFVVGVPSTMGEPVAIEHFADHVFGVCLVNDWSARDIQAFEYQPLGPFLGKSFATSMSAWVVPLDALESARLPAGSTGEVVQDYLREPEPWGFDLELELSVNGEVMSQPPYRSMFWSPAQMLAHLTVNGASLRTGDLYASGTVSGSEPDQVGSLIERWENSRFLADGDEVVIRGTAPGLNGTRISLGEVRGRIDPPR